MRSFLVLVCMMVTGGAWAQQCPECTLADACIRVYSESVEQIKSDTKKKEADFQKGMHKMNLDKKGEDLTQRGTLRMRESMKLLVRFEIEILKECLGKIR